MNIPQLLTVASWCETLARFVDPASVVSSTAAVSATLVWWRWEIAQDLRDLGEAAIAIPHLCLTELLVAYRGHDGTGRHRAGPVAEHGPEPVEEDPGGCAPGVPEPSTGGA